MPSIGSTRPGDLGRTLRDTDTNLLTQQGVRWRAKPHAIIYRNAAQSQGTGFNSIPWDTESFQSENSGIWTSGNPTVLELPIRGWWAADARVSFSANATGIRQSIILDAATGELDRDIHLNPTGSSNAIMRPFSRIWSDGTNYFVVQTAQSSGGSLALAVGQRFCRVEVIYLGR